MAHVDHDHATDLIRGILCSRCNQALGLLDDDPERFAAAIAYLTNPPNQIAPQRVKKLPGAERTHCPFGHPYAGENLMLAHGGRHRRCRECECRNGRYLDPL